MSPPPHTHRARLLLNPSGVPHPARSPGMLLREDSSACAWNQAGMLPSPGKLRGDGSMLRHRAGAQPPTVPRDGSGGGRDSTNTQPQAGPQSFCSPSSHLIPRDAPQGGWLHALTEPSDPAVLLRDAPGGSAPCRGTAVALPGLGPGPGRARCPPGPRRTPRAAPVAAEPLREGKGGRHGNAAKLGERLLPWKHGVSSSDHRRA